MFHLLLGATLGIHYLDVHRNTLHVGIVILLLNLLLLRFTIHMIKLQFQPTVGCREVANNLLRA